MITTDNNAAATWALPSGQALHSMFYQLQVERAHFTAEETEAGNGQATCPTPYC